MAKKKNPAKKKKPTKKVHTPTPGPVVRRRVRLSELYLDPANAREHKEKNIAAIIGSLREFGQVEPLVVQKSTGKIIGGNGRYTAMLELGWTETDIVELDIDDTKAVALGIALNRTGELAEWDYKTLASLTAALQASGFDMEVIGWSDDDLSPILAADWTPPEADGDLGDIARGDDEEESVPSIKLTADQRYQFEQAANRVRTIADDQSIADGQCLVLICSGYMSHRQ